MINPKEICFFVTYNDRYAKMADITIFGNMSRYCALHGYHFWIDKQDENIYKDRYPSWHKVKKPIEILENNKQFKWLFFIDADCLIMNPTIKLESIIDENYSFILPVHGTKAIDTPMTTIPGYDNIILSQFFLKNDEIGISIFKDIWESKESPSSLNSFDFENRQTRITVDKSEFRDKIKVIDEHILNRFWYINSPFMVVAFPKANDNVWKLGDFIVHVTGYETHERVKLLSDLDYFSGGLLYKWKCDGNEIKLVPACDVLGVKVDLYDKNNNLITRYNLGDVYPTLSYTLYVDKSLDKEDLIVKGYNSKDELISMFYFKK